MSQDDSTAPEGVRTATVGGRSGRTWLLVGLALVLVIGLVGFFALRGDDAEADGPDCVKDEISLTTAPVMEPLVDEAVATVTADEPCI